MPRGAVISQGSGGENLTHFTAVRIRVTGNGDLKMKLFSQDDINTQDLVPLSMSAATNIQPTRLCNFIEQRATLEVKTTEKDETFRINRIILFVKEFASSYPG